MFATFAILVGTGTLAADLDCSSLAASGCTLASGETAPLCTFSGLTPLAAGLSQFRRPSAVEQGAPWCVETAADWTGA